MNKTKCQKCFFGASMEGYSNTIYEFSKAINKNNEINYKNGELGCRNYNNYEKSISSYKKLFN